MSYEDLDVLYRSRITLIKILKENGYETKDYERFSPWETEAMAIGQTSFQIDVTKTNPDGPITKCRVVYSLQKLKQKIYGFLSALTNTEDPNSVDPLTTEVIVILLEDVADVFHKAALDEWLKNKLRIRFFKAHTLVYDPPRPHSCSSSREAPARGTRRVHEAELSSLKGQSSNDPLPRGHYCTCTRSSSWRYHKDYTPEPFSGSLRHLQGLCPLNSRDGIGL